MTTNNAIDTATGATGTVLAGAGVGTPPTFTASPSGLTNVSSTSFTLNGRMRNLVNMTITSAQLLNFTASNTPIQIVAAQGPNTLIIPITLTVNYVFNTTPYACTSASSDRLDLYFTGTGGVSGLTNIIISTIFPFGSGGTTGFASSGSWMWEFGGIGANLSGTAGLAYPTGAQLYMNTALMLAHSSGGVNISVVNNDWTAGDGTMYLTLQYDVATGLP